MGAFNSDFTVLVDNKMFWIKMGLMTPTEIRESQDNAKKRKVRQLQGEKTEKHTDTLPKLKSLLAKIEKIKSYPLSCYP